MAVKKIKDKWHPIGKKGPWKSGFSSEAKAKKALTQSNRYFKSLGKPKKKKTTKKKTAKKPKDVKKVSKKRSWVGWARLGVYVIAAVAPAVDQVAKHGFTKVAAQRIGQVYTARDHNGKLSWQSGVGTYGPLACVAAVDTIASKAGVYKRMASL